MTEIKAITSGKSGNDRDAALEDLFSKMPEEAEVDIRLPSKGKFYTGLKPITIAPLTYEEEERILRSKSSGANSIDLLLAKCISGVEISDLLQMDKLYLLMKVREVSYGAEYKFSIACPHCATDVSTEINLDTGLNIKEVEDDLEDPRTLKLPKLGVDAVVRFPRSSEEPFHADNETMIKNLYKFVKSLDGNEDTVFINKALKRLHIMDVKSLVKEVFRGEYGVDPRFMFDCPHCKESSMMAVPLDIDFFSVS
tara:strand:- start:233 stop:991 length:759 start_codon:yes stop_codon:yes gene_type:complete